MLIIVSISISRDNEKITVRMLLIVVKIITTAMLIKIILVTRSSLIIKNNINCNGRNKNRNLHRSSSARNRIEENTSDMTGNEN